MNSIFFKYAACIFGKILVGKCCFLYLIIKNETFCAQKYAQKVSF